MTNPAQSPTQLTVAADLRIMKNDLCTVPLSACQLALVLMAAQQAVIQDPERRWLPPEFVQDLRGALWTITALARSAFREAVHDEVMDAWQRIEDAGVFNA